MYSDRTLSDYFNLTTPIEFVAICEIKSVLDKNSIDEINNFPDKLWCIKLNEIEFNSVKLIIKENKMLAYRD